MTTATTEQPSATSAARERILDTAFRLFYARGLRAVGVDTIIAESGVAKATFYRHFPAKDDLILAYLDKVDARVDRPAARRRRTPQDPNPKTSSSACSTPSPPPAADPDTGAARSSTPPPRPPPEHPCTTGPSRTSRTCWPGYGTSHNTPGHPIPTSLHVR